MDKFDRIYCLHKVFQQRHYPVSLNTICDELECSVPTAKRILREMRDYLGAPIINKRGQGYFYDRDESFELPGLWFTSSEMESLLAMKAMMHHIGPGFLDEHLQPLWGKIEQFLSKGALKKFDWNRFRILGMNQREINLPHFSVVASSLISRRKINFSYHARSTDELTDREVSPQRMTHYRDNWYLDAFCHKRNALRTFSMDRIGNVAVLDKPAKNISEKDLNSHFANAYGILSGKAQDIAVLRFSPSRAKWISAESWHPEQSSCFLEDGSYELRFPFNEMDELILDICRFGSDVEVIGPPELRKEVKTRLLMAAKQYEL